MARLSITKTPMPDGVSIIVSGEAGIEEIDFLESELQSIAGQKPATVLCDLSKLTYISSAGMEAFLRLRLSLTKHGGEVRLADVSPHIRESFHRVRLDQMFHFVK